MASSARPPVRTPHSAPTLGEFALQATTNTAAGYNLLAPRFEATPYATPLEVVTACRRRIDLRYPPGSGLHGADLGCGTGRGALELLATCAKVDGYDFSRGMLAQARILAESRGVSSERLHLIFSDLATVELPRARYDRIVSFGAWGHILRPWSQRLAYEIGDSLAPGGVFYTVTADPASPLQLRWWKSAIFDMTIQARNRLLGDPFHMYYGINSTLEVKALFEKTGYEVILEPVPGSPHRELTLLSLLCNP